MLHCITFIVLVGSSNYCSTVMSSLWYDVSSVVVWSHSVVVVCL